jgi:hypothetical protein
MAKRHDENKIMTNISLMTKISQGRKQWETGFEHL